MMIGVLPSPSKNRWTELITSSLVRNQGGGNTREEHMKAGMIVAGLIFIWFMMDLSRELKWNPVDSIGGLFGYGMVIAFAAFFCWIIYKSINGK
jgi:hypothetical protein